MNRLLSITGNNPFYPYWFLFVHPLGETHCLHQSKRGRSYVWTGGGSKGRKRWQSTLWERDLKGIRWPQRQLCSERFEIGTSSMLVKVIANEQPRKDTRLRGSSLIEPCAIVPAYSNVRQHLWCNSEQRMRCFRANMWYRIHELCVCVFVSPVLITSSTSHWVDIHLHQRR